MRRSLLLVAALAIAGCSTVASGEDSPTVAAPDHLSISSTTATPTTTTVPPTTTTTLPPAPPPRRVTEQAWTPFATVGGVMLHHPSARIEHVGFHQSNHDGAQQLDPMPTAVFPLTLETRDRETGSRTAVDVVADPMIELRSPVTGTVKRAGQYILYCEHRDNFVVIEPDSHPGWEVKMLHFEGLRVAKGERVVAGETVIGRNPRQLPFESQVDEARSADPAWPHVHIEVVDPTIKDRPSPDGGCS